MKRTSSLLLASILALVLCASLIGCSAVEEFDTDVYTEEPVEDVTIEPVLVSAGEYGPEARQYMEALTDIGARWSGTEEEAAAQQVIVDAFSAMGYDPEVRPFTAIGDDGEAVDSANVVAVKPGDSSQVIVVGAHYDSSDESLGADDNASGVAVLLETASLLKDEATPYTLNFVALGAEEAGLLGSTAFVGELDSQETADIILYVNMDSLSAGNITYIYSSPDATGARDWALEWADANGFDLQTIEDVNLSQDGEATADYAAFEQEGIPWLYFEATDWTLGEQDGYTQVDPEYGSNGAIIHTEYDNLAYFDETFPGRVEANLNLYVNVLYQILTAYQP